MNPNREVTPVTNDNDGPEGFAIPISLEQLLGGMGGRKKRLTDEERIAQVKEAFNATLDAALGGCPGGKEDEQHRQRDEAMLTLIRNSFRMDMVPSQVADAVAKVLAFDVTHSASNGEELGKEIGTLFSASTINRCLLIAGAVLRVKDLPPQSGQNSTGLYL